MKNVKTGKKKKKKNQISRAAFVNFAHIYNTSRIHLDEDI